MIEHYNAFISYRHAPEDIKVAEAIHKGLERFHIPVKIQKTTGMKRINRIFRDKAELPLTADLNDTIAGALDNSDYLIVICSTNTKESVWVTREIEYFLRSHSRNQVLTVLVNGEPQDVIPEILQFEDRQVLNQYGQYQTVRIPIEPLSCDYRMPLRKADKIELPRLASVLIGCSYDELMNRRRAYLMRRLVLGFAAVLTFMIAFSIYLIYSANAIRQNYLEALRNQSKYIANESEKYLEDEQRITAILLALEALPKDDADERPITPEAIKALTDATLAYEGNDGDNINTAWNYVMPSEVKDFILSPDGKTLAIRDTNSVVGVWNTGTHERIVYFERPDFRVIGMDYFNDDDLVVWSTKHVVCYDTVSGEKLWDYELENDSFIYQDELLIFEDSILLLTGRGKYIELESATGKELEVVSFSLEGKEEQATFSLSELSPDKKYLAFSAVEGWNQYLFGIIDLSTKEIIHSQTLDCFVQDIGWAGDKIMLATMEVDFSSSMSYGDMETLNPDTTTIHCYNSSDLSEKWTSDFTTYGVNKENGFVELSEGKSVVFYAGDTACIYDVETGEKQFSHNLNSTILHVSDRDGDGTPIYITEDGGFAYPAKSLGTEAVYNYSRFANDLSKVDVCDGIYVTREGGKEVIFYGTKEYDHNWTSFSDDVTFRSYNNEYYMDEDVLAIISDGDDGAVLTTYDLVDTKNVRQIILSDCTAYSTNILGIYQGSIYLAFDSVGEFVLYSVDIQSGEVKNEGEFKLKKNVDNSISFSNGKIIYCSSKGSQIGVNIYDIGTKKTFEETLPSDAGEPVKPPRLFEKAGMVVYSGELCYVVDVDSGDMNPVETAEDWNGCVCVSNNSNDKLVAVSDGLKILLVERDGSVKKSIPCQGSDPIGMTFIEGKNELLVLYIDGSLCWYNMEGVSIRKTSVTTLSNYHDDVEFTFDNENNLLYIQQSILTDVVDLNSAIELKYILNSFGHHAGTDTFITEWYDKSTEVKVGYYKRYTVEELIERAKEIVGDSELSDEMKQIYGIDD